MAELTCETFYIVPCVSCYYSSYCTTEGWESASISDDDEDGEWVDVHHSSDEDAGEMVRMKPHKISVIKSCVVQV